MKILFVVPSLKSGGLERVASVLSSNWSRKEGMQVYLLTLDSKPSFYGLDECVKLQQAPLYIDTKHRWVKAVMLWFWLRKQASKIQPDVILGFGEGYNAFVSASLSFLEKPIFLGNRTTPVTSLTGIRGLINPIFYKKATRVFVQTNKSIEILKPKYKQTHFEVIPNPITEFTNNVDYSKKTILNVGSLGGKKNQLGLIRIFSKLPSEFQDWKLVFAGDGPNRSQLEYFVEAKGLQGRVQFAGTVKDLNELYGQVSIFAFTSLLEGFPNALGEAMRAGMAVISYDCLTGPGELIIDGANGYLVEVEDENEYLKRLTNLMGDKVLRERFGHAARESTESYGADEIASIYLNRFSESLKSR